MNDNLLNVKRDIVIAQALQSTCIRMRKKWWGAKRPHEVLYTMGEVCRVI